MAREPKKTTPEKKPIEQYQHKGKKRLNNPPVGLVTPETDNEEPKKTYSYDPHLDPQLVWAGKEEHTSLEVPSVSLHVHERIDPRTIIEAAKKKNGGPQMSLFQSPAENPPLREAIEFYKHKHNWSNRLIAGDNLLVMNSLLEKEGMAGQVQMVYMDPPYGIRYGSNFQPFVNNRDVKDGKDEDLTAEPEMIKAFRDTWELGIHSYLTYLRDRLLLAKELLADTGSVFVQIGDENVHLVRLILDEVFGPANFCAQINYRSMTPLGQSGLASVYDYILWYAKDHAKHKFRAVFDEKPLEEEPEYRFLDEDSGRYRKLTREEIRDLTPKDRRRVFKRSDLASSGYTPSCTFEFEFEGKLVQPKSGKSWRTHPAGVEKLIRKHRLFLLGERIYFRQFHSDFPYMQLENSWHDTAAGFGAPKVYVVQTHTKVVARCMWMTTDPGDLVLDPTCGSGTTAYVAEQWGRRWITSDTSRVATTLAKQRIMTASFDYYRLAHPEEGVDSGFEYAPVPHITLESIANDEPAPKETIYDDPVRETNKARVAGPFTVEAVPAPVVRSLEESNVTGQPLTADVSIARCGATARNRQWRDELYRSGIRGRAGQRIDFTRVEPLPGTRWLHADAETKEGAPQRAAISFGPEYAPMEQRQVELAIEEARKLVPKPRIIVFAAFQFDPEAAKDIDELNWPGVTLLKAQMNADLLTEDLKKKRASNESFWLIGQPDIDVHPIEQGEDKGKCRITVNGFDYYNTKSGKVESGGTERIAMWMLDPDYDGRSLLPRQVFFPMAGEDEGWAKLAASLRAEIDLELIKAYRGTESLPFAAGANKRAAVKIIDDRGIESLRIVDLE
jgi:adenine-specific DNA-methyltransferase